jgi:hypothetical protein
VELILRTVHANFSDNGAGGDWLPCVDLISDSGHTIARCCDPNVVVTAGDDAEVTWFPDVKPVGSSTPSSASVVYSRGHTDQNLGDAGITVPSHGQIRAPMAHIDVDATGAITWEQTVNPNDTACVHGPGLFIVQTSAHFQTTGAGEVAFAYASAGDEWPTMSWGTLSVLDSPAGSTDPGGLPTNLSHSLIHVVGAGSQTVSLLLEQNIAFNVNVTQAYMSIIGFPGV